MTADEVFASLPDGFGGRSVFDAARSTCREYVILQAPDGRVSDEICLDDPAAADQVAAFTGSSGGTG